MADEQFDFLVRQNFTIHANTVKIMLEMGIATKRDVSTFLDEGERMHELLGVDPNPLMIQFRINLENLELPES